MHSDQHYKIKEAWYKNNKRELSLYINTGKLIGKIGKVVEISDSTYSIQVENEPLRKFQYTKIEEIDENQNPIFQSALDITGRQVSDGQVVCYSVSVGRSSHALEIGKVIKTNASGSLTVEPIIQNGKKIPPGYWNRQRSQISSNRTMILPIDNSFVMTWVLSDFEVFKENALLNF